MLSEEQKTSKSTTQEEWGGGSLQSMNLGVLLVGQLSQAINWSNDPSFRKLECKPWVDLQVVSGDRNNEKPNSVDVPESVVSVQEVVTNARSQPIQDDNVSVKNPVSTNDVLVDGIQDPEESTERNETAPPEIQSSKKGAIEESTAGLPHELTGLPSDVATEIVAVEVGKNEFETNSNFDNSTLGLSEESKSQRNFNDETKIESLSSVKSSEESLTVPAIPLDSNRTDLSSSISNLESSVSAVELDAKPCSVAKSSMRDSIRKSSSVQVISNDVVAKSTKPLPRPPYEVSERTPAPKVVVKSPGREMPQDDYLVQLERLVVELNMELARVRGEEATVDPIEQMANRIIALNLENLALREQLQQSNPKS